MDKAKVSRTGDAIATAPGAVAISGVATVHMTGPPPARSYYREQISQTVQSPLLDRDAELAELAEFCTSSDEGAPAYWWWRAPKWSGKTALMRAFVLDPPAGVRVVSFFITARLLGHDTRTAFVDIVGEQLAEILAEPSPIALPLHMRDSNLMGLLARAAEECRERGERLVLLIDGLDEDRGTPHDHPAQGSSIAAALPMCPPAGMRIVVSGRPSPSLPSDVPAEHPLHNTAVLRPLDASPHAKVAKDRMLLELSHVLHAGQNEQDLLGLLTAAGGGLTAADLADLTSQAPGQVRRRLRGVLGRILETRGGHPRRDAEVYLLGHEGLHAIATEEFGEQRLEQYRQHLHDWADRYREFGWPASTPTYLLAPYGQLLIELQDRERLVALALSPERHDQMFARYGNDAAAGWEILNAQELGARVAVPDLVTLGTLLIRRLGLAARSEQIPKDLSAAWARLGDFEKAEALARGYAAPAARGQALAAVAAAAGAVDLELCRRLVADVEVIVNGLGEPSALVEVGIELVAALASLDLEAAVHRAIEVENDIRRVDDEYIEDTYRTELVRKCSEARLWDAAERFSLTIEDSYHKSVALDNLARDLAAAREWDRADRTVEHLEDARDRGRVASVLCWELACAGLFDRSEETARRIEDPAWQEAALAEVAIIAAGNNMPLAESLVEELSSLGWSPAAAHIELAKRVVSQAKLDVILSRWNSHAPPKLLAQLAGIVVPVDRSIADDLADRAIEAWLSLPDDERDRGWMDIVDAFAWSGMWDHAIHVARQLRRVAVQARYLAWLAAYQATKDPAGARTTAIEAEDVARRTEDRQRRDKERSHLIDAMSATDKRDRGRPALTGFASAVFPLPPEGQCDPEDLLHAITDYDERFNTLIAACEACARAGRWDDLARLADHAETPLDRAHIRVLVLAVVAQHDPEAAARVASDSLHLLRTSDDDDRPHVTSRLCEELLLVGMVDAAEGIARNEPLPLLGVRELASVAGARLRTAPSRAARIADDAERIASEIADANKRAAALVALVVGLADTRQVERAARVASSIEYPDERSSAYRLLCDALVQQRMWAEAERAACAIGDEEITSYKYLRILDGVAQEAASEDQPGRRSALVSLARTIFARSLARTSSFATATAVAAVLPVEVKELCETLLPELTD
ncbi:hypothetical protein [Lentzea sp. NPDC051838]|uniref:hypothetical protein n=1 Tax=Lentzea sp. NPDC051838 TaxID=3154849 RepID=UPI003419257C